MPKRAIIISEDCPFCPDGQLDWRLDANGQLYSHGKNCCCTTIFLGPEPTKVRQDAAKAVDDPDPEKTSAEIQTRPADRPEPVEPGPEPEPGVDDKPKRGRLWFE